MEFKNTAIVLNLDTNGLGVIRSLGRLGITVHGIDYRPGLPGMVSRYCAKSYVLPDPASEPEALLEALLELRGEFQEPPVLLPTADYYVLFMSKYREQLLQQYRFNIPPPEIVQSIIDKAMQYELAMRHNVPLPFTAFINSAAQAEEAATTLRYPAIIKGKTAFAWSRHYKVKGFRVDSKEEFLAKVAEVAATGIEMVVQEIIPGPNSNHYKVCAYLGVNGGLLASFSTQKTRQFPVDFGVGTYMTSVKLPGLIESGTAFMQAINYTGVGSIEFKKDERDGTFKFIELNPRLWMQNIHAAYAGINFALFNYADCVGHAPAPRFTFKEGVTWLDGIQDFQSFMGNLRLGRLSAVEWLYSVLNADCSAYFAMDDLRPGWQNSEYGKKFLRLPLKLVRPR